MTIKITIKTSNTNSYYDSINNMQHRLTYRTAQHSTQKHKPAQKRNTQNDTAHNGTAHNGTTTAQNCRAERAALPGRDSFVLVGVPERHVPLAPGGCQEERRGRVVLKREKPPHCHRLGGHLNHAQYK